MSKCHWLCPDQSIFEYDRRNDLGNKTQMTAILFLVKSKQSKCTSTKWSEVFLWAKIKITNNRIWLVVPPPTPLSPISVSLHCHHSHRKALAARNTDIISALLISILRCVEIFLAHPTKGNRWWTTVHGVTSVSVGRQAMVCGVAGATLFSPVKDAKENKWESWCLILIKSSCLSLCFYVFEGRYQCTMSKSSWFCWYQLYLSQHWSFFLITLTWQDMFVSILMLT